MQQIGSVFAHSAASAAEPVFARCRMVAIRFPTLGLGLRISRCFRLRSAGIRTVCGSSRRHLPHPSALGKCQGRSNRKKQEKNQAQGNAVFRFTHWLPRRYEGKSPPESGKYVPAQRPSSTRELPYAGGDEVTLGRAPALTTEDTENTEENKTISCGFIQMSFSSVRLCVLRGKAFFEMLQAGCRGASVNIVVNLYLCYEFSGFSFYRRAFCPACPVRRGHGHPAVFKGDIHQSLL